MQVRNLGHKLAVFGLTAPFVVSNAFAQAQGGGDGITAAMDAVDLAGIATKVIAAGIVIVGIALAFKGPDLAKRVVRKV